MAEKAIELESEIAEKEKRINEINIIKIKIQEIDEKEKRLKELEKTNSFLDKDIEILELSIWKA